MQKNILKLLLLLLIIPLVNGCSDSSDGAKTQEPIVVYSSRAEYLIKPFLEEFTEKTAIPVILHTGNANAIIERLKAEGANTPADILMTVDVGNLWYAATQDLFLGMESETIENNIPAHLRDPELFWTGLSVRARTLVYNSEKVKPSELSTYEDLASSKWQDRLCLRTSEAVYNKSLVGALLNNLGQAETEKIVKGWVDNLATKPQAKDSLVLDAIAAGQCDVGITNSYYFGRMQSKNPDVPVGIFWANQETSGTHINISGAGVLQHSKNPQAALELIEWLTGPEAQVEFGSLNKEFPANKSIELDDQLESWGSFKQDTLNLRKVGEKQQEATKLMQRLGFE